MQIEFILYVADQNKSKLFYEEVLQLPPSLDVPGMTEFTIDENVKIGLMPENGIAKILADKTPHPNKGSGIPRCEIYLKIQNSKQYYERAVKAGAVIVSNISARDWGDIVGYVADPDGHILAFAESNN